MDTGLRGKTALITGGGSGIGRAIALALAAEGVDVAIASRKPDPKTVSEIESHGVKAVAIKADVSSEQQVVRMVQEAIRTLGRLDLYVNNAAWAWHEPITRLTAEAWRLTIDTNLSGAVFAGREVARHMIERRTGSILIVGSVAEFLRSYGETSYHITKTSLHVLTTALAVELAPFGIRVNILIPGHYPTRLTSGMPEDREHRLIRQIPMRRFGKPEELGPAAVLLLSDKLSPYTTGTQIVVDGGLSLHALAIIDDEDISGMNAPPWDSDKEGECE